MTLPRAHNLAASLDPRDNAVNLLRLVFALLVVVSHAWPLGGFGADPHLGSITLGTTSVEGFFLMSGWLITRSGDRGTSTGRFLWHRALRILPGFWVSLILVAFGFAAAGYAHVHGTLSGFLTSGPTPVRYVLTNVDVDVQRYDISDALTRIGDHNGWNGSLHTLWQESACYLLIAVLTAAGLLRRRGVLLGLTGVMFVLAQVQWHGHVLSLPVVYGAENAGYVLAFLVGSLAYVYGDRVPLGTRWAAAAFVFALATSVKSGIYILVGFPAFAYVIFWLAVNLPGHRVGRTHDYSYGIYIYAYPVQTLLTVYGLNHHSLPLYLVLSVVCTLPLAWLSWTLVEAPALRLKAWTPSRRGAQPSVSSTTT